jgi:hypothetical protein
VMSPRVRPVVPEKRRPKYTLPVMVRYGILTLAASVTSIAPLPLLMAALMVPQPSNVLPA